MTAAKTGPSPENGSRSKFIGTRENNARRKNSNVMNGSYGKYFIRWLSRKPRVLFSYARRISRVSITYNVHGFRARKKHIFLNSTQETITARRSNLCSVDIPLKLGANRLERNLPKRRVMLIFD